MESDFTPVLRVEPQRHRLMRRDRRTASVADLPTAGPGRQFNSAVMWETAISQPESDELPSHF